MNYCMEAIFRRWRAEVGLRDDGQEFEDDEDARTPRLFSRLDNQIEHLFFLSVRSMLWSSQKWEDGGDEKASAKSAPIAGMRKGVHKAKKLFLCATPKKAADAYNCGLVNAVADHTDGLDAKLAAVLEGFQSYLSEWPALSKMAINLLTHESLAIPKQLKVCGESSQRPASDAVSQMVHALIGKSVRRPPGKTKPSIKWVPGVWRQSRLTCRSISGRLLKVSG